MRPLDDVIDAGVRFLDRRLGAEVPGLWCDFAVSGVSAGSTECVSAFISAQIATIPEGRALAADVVGRLSSRARETGGWGYREDVPEDCDSTAWVLLAAAAAGVDLPRRLVERGTRFIAAHQGDDGGFATYGPTAKASLTPADQVGWFEPEVSVTSSAVLALSTCRYPAVERLRRARRYIAACRRDDVWASYWWNGFGYATYLSLAAMSTDAHVPDEDWFAATRRAILVRRGVSGGWANEPAGPDNGFSTSFALRALLITDQTLALRDEIVESASYLSGLTTSSGGAPGSAEMLAPGGFQGSDVLLLDNGAVTTACVIRALHEVRTRLSSPT